MRYYKTNTGYVATVGELDAVEITEAEYTAVMQTAETNYAINAAQTDTVTDADRMQALLSTVTITAPAGGSVDGDAVSLPFKAGYRWEKICADGAVSFQLVEDADAIGSEGNPIIYTDGVQLINGAYYLVDGVRNLYMGDSGFIEW